MSSIADQAESVKTCQKESFGRERDSLPVDCEPTGGEASDCFGVGTAFRFEDAPGEGLGGVVVENRHGLLNDNRSVVVFIIGKVDRTSADPHTSRERGRMNALAVITLPTKSGYEGWVNV